MGKATEKKVTEIVDHLCKNISTDMALDGIFNKLPVGFIYQALERKILAMDKGECLCLDSIMECTEIILTHAYHLASPNIQTTENIMNILKDRVVDNLRKLEKFKK